MNFHRLVGLAGVAKTESQITQVIGFYFEICVMMVVIWLGLQWNLETRGQLPQHVQDLSNWGIWFFFVIETSILALFSRDRFDYLVTNWMNLIIIAVGIILILHYSAFAAILHFVRPLLIVILLLPWADNLVAALSDNRLGTTLIAAAIVTVLSGLMISGVDPAIPSPIDGIWWAWVTVSTVGYGDFVPVSAIGKIFGSMLILMGLALFAVITANFSAIFVKRGLAKETREIAAEEEEIRELLKEVKSIHMNEQSILNVLTDIQKRLEKLETK